MKKFDLSNIFNVKGKSARHKIINQFGLDKYDKRVFLNNLEELEKKAESGGESSVLEEKDCNFYDYDGTLLYSYTKEEALALTELPPLPTQPGLICQEWNYDLQDIANNKAIIDIGATYITDDGSTRIYINNIIPNKQFKLNLICQYPTDTYIDWGDGNITQATNLTHNYDNKGNYIIKITCKNGLFALGGNSELITGILSYYKDNVCKIEIGNNIESISNNAFREYDLKSISIPNNIKSFGTTVFQNSAIKFISLPKSITDISNYCFGGSKLEKIILSKELTNIGTAVFYHLYKLKKLNINSFINISNYCFEGSYNLEYVFFINYDKIPTLDAYSIRDDLLLKVVVPDNLYDEWINATNWANIADKIIKVSDYESLNV